MHPKNQQNNDYSPDKQTHRISQIDMNNAMLSSTFELLFDKLVS